MCTRGKSLREDGYSRRSLREDVVLGTCTRKRDTAAMRSSPENAHKSPTLAWRPRECANGASQDALASYLWGGPKTALENTPERRHISLVRRGPWKSGQRPGTRALTQSRARITRSCENERRTDWGQKRPKRPSSAWEASRTIGSSGAAAVGAEAVGVAIGHSPLPSA